MRNKFFLLGQAIFTKAIAAVDVMFSATIHNSCERQRRKGRRNCLRHRYIFEVMLRFVSNESELNKSGPTRFKLHKRLDFILVLFYNKLLCY
jgi:hypothetical protein